MPFTPRATALLDALHSRPVVGDGAMGTMLQDFRAAPPGETPDDECNELLNVTNPDVVAAVHDAYLAVGVDAITTNTFGANAVNLADYDLADRVEELAQAGAQIARESADAAVARFGEPRWVLGSLGPGSKLPSLGHITYRELRDTYTDAARGLLRGGVDAILLETVQDLLQAKAAVTGARRAMRELGVTVPVLVSVTVEESGTMLLGTDIAAALALLQGLGVDGIGLNCATGPDLMAEHVRFLAEHSPVPISVIPNAGLPELGPDGAVYPLSPDALATAQARFVAEQGVSLVGGCCGTTPDHLRAVVEAVRELRLARRVVEPRRDVSSLYSATPLSTDLLTVGERTNANGSRAFRDLLLAEDWDGVVALAKSQAASGAQLLDLCIDYVGRSGTEDMAAAVGRLASAATVPLMIDSTEPTVLAAGLELLGARPVVNSVNYEDGDGPESRFARTMALVREHGTAVVALTIDEDGQARTSALKVAIATRLINALTTEWGMSVEDIIIDPLTFPIATGQDETRRDAIETLTAISEIKRRFPGVHIMLGISNISFGLLPPARKVLNSVFLAEAQAAGLDVAITPAGKILPRSEIPAEVWQAAEDLVWDRREYDPNGEVVYDPLTRLLELFPAAPAPATNVILGGGSAPSDVILRPGAGDSSVILRPGAAGSAESIAASLATSPADRIAARIIDGDRSGLEDDLADALAAGLAPLGVLNEILLPAMAVVGERFGAGQTQLPFVLQSAEVMKAAVNWLDPHLAKDDDSGTRGTIVLATVRGDVHDIGKNLVDIILANNGYRVINIGIKVPIDQIIDAAVANDADVIGMSGLLVKSTQIMRENLSVLTERGLARRWPVILGGAALNRRFVEDDLAAEFPGTVRYAKDAFAGLALMPELVAAARDGRAK